MSAKSSHPSATSSTTTTTDDEYHDSIFFFMGRVNPPTLGHINLMFDLLKTAQENFENPLIMIFLSATTNKDRWEKKLFAYSDANQQKKLKLLLSTSNIKFVTKGDGRNGVKNELRENPLNFTTKSYYVNTMLKNYIDSKKDTSLLALKQNNFKIFEARRGLFDCFGQVLEMAKKNYLLDEKLYYIYGDENERKTNICDVGCTYENPPSHQLTCRTTLSRNLISKMANSTTYPHTYKKEWFRRFQCIPVARPDGGWSGSKIRLLAAGKLPSKSVFVSHYTKNKLLLTTGQANELYDKVRENILNIGNIEPDTASLATQNVQHHQQPSSNKKQKEAKKGGRKRRTKKKKTRKKRRKIKNKRNKQKKTRCNKTKRRKRKK